MIRRPDDAQSAAAGFKRPVANPKGRAGPDPCGSCGRSYGFVHRLLTEADATMRTRGGPNVSDRTANRRATAVAASADARIRAAHTSYVAQLLTGRTIPRYRPRAVVGADAAPASAACWSTARGGEFAESDGHDLDAGGPLLLQFPRTGALLRRSISRRVGTVYSICVKVVSSPHEPGGASGAARAPVIRLASGVRPAWWNKVMPAERAS
ncbi:helix-turn-helix domain-containing protein [Streptomyces sp. NPDC059467]|uniref:helix-turn-helix domain-containing protein n=1 Tax=Streptomyces sp. NPDC059467 TaxID=3346844 RepID=UPI00368616FB